MLSRMGLMIEPARRVEGFAVCGRSKRSDIERRATIGVLRERVLDPASSQYTGGCKPQELSATNVHSCCSVHGHAAFGLKGRIKLIRSQHV
jgi:hypothetical protein